MGALRAVRLVPLKQPNPQASRYAMPAPHHPSPQRQQDPASSPQGGAAFAAASSASPAQSLQRWLHSPWAGLIGGLLAVFGWAAYSVAAKAGLAGGFSVGELSALRYLVPALIFIPFYPMLWRSLSSIGLPRLAFMALLGGPLYGWAIMKGLSLAPIADAVVIGPVAVLTTTVLLAWRLDGVLPTPRQWAGGALLAIGLGFLSSNAGASDHELPLRWLGDLAFAASGAAWGLFTMLLRRWGMPPVTATAGVAGLSLIALAPVAVYGLLMQEHNHTLAQWGFQVLAQGVVGGLIALLCYVTAVRALGPVRAAYFPAFVPGVTMVMAGLAGIERIGFIAAVGVVILTTGMLIAQSGAVARR